MSYGGSRCLDFGWPILVVLGAKVTLARLRRRFKKPLVIGPTLSVILRPPIDSIAGLFKVAGSY